MLIVKEHSLLVLELVRNLAREHLLCFKLSQELAQSVKQLLLLVLMEMNLAS